MVIGLLFLTVFILPLLSGGSGGTTSNSQQITASTVEREPLPAGSVNETDYYTDHANWIDNPGVIEEGLKYFYQKTGVQPHVYITDNINGDTHASSEDVGAFAQEQYDELFTDEGHFLLMFYEPPSGTEYFSYYVTGTAAEQVVDQEAANIILDYVDRYYYDTELNEDQFFAKAFRDAADRMMEVTTSPWIPVFMVLGVGVILALLYYWWKKRKEQEAIEAKRTEEILNTPLDTFGTEDVDEALIRKYSDEEDTKDK
ncbi:hypothetical protein HZY86_07570 [Aerococcaceae bacterium DSM 111020]|nr:hypothetical protein [Aerococcaceae bacterium DSM 111020]